MKRKLLTTLCLCLALPLGAAFAGQEPDDLEAFRSNLGECVTGLEGLPAPLLEVIYDHPEALAEVRERLANMDEAQLAELRDALHNIPFWQNLPAVLSQATQQQDPSLFDYGTALDALTPPQDPEAFRGKWMEFFDELDRIPSDQAGRAFFDKVAGVREQIAAMSPGELEELRAGVRERAAEWSDAIRQRREQDQLAVRVDPLARWSAVIEKTEAIRSGAIQPFERMPQEESVALRGVDDTGLSGASGATGGIADLVLQPEVPDAPITSPINGCPGGLSGVLCEIGEIFSAIVAFPGQVASFAVNAFNDIIDFIAPAATLIDDPTDIVALMGIDLDDPNWFDFLVRAVPILRPPCPADGAFIPGFGEVGTKRATLACQRSIGWASKALYDNAPDDIWGVPGKLLLAILYYPVDYLCMCFDEASDIRFDDLQAEHRDLTDERLDVVVGTRATQSSVNSAQAGVGDVDGDVALLDLSLDKANAEADALYAAEQAQSQFLLDFQTLALQMRIEANLHQNGNNRVSRFQLPAANGGMLEAVQLVVENTIQSRIDAGRVVGGALQELYDGDVDYQAGAFKDAYSHYRRAYRMAVSGGYDPYTE